MFRHLFAAHPEMLRFNFPFISSNGQVNYNALRSQALKEIQKFSNVMSTIDRKPDLDIALQDVVLSLSKVGFLMNHFESLSLCVLASMEAVLGMKWQERERKAWAVAIGLLGRLARDVMS